MLPISCCSSTGRKHRLPSATTESQCSILSRLAPRAVSRSDVDESFRDRARAELAWWALTARLHEQEPREHSRQVGHTCGVVVHDEPRRSQPATRGRERLEREWDVELTCSQHRVRDAGKHGADRRPGRGAPNMVSTSRSGVPHSTSTTPAHSASPTTVHTTVPGDFGVPNDRYQSEPFASTCATLANVSTLLTDVGFDSWPRECPASGSCACQPSCGAVANRPCTYGGSQRGRGSLPSMTSRSAFSSPKRYSSGPATSHDRKITDEPSLLELRDGPHDAARARARSSPSMR